MDGVCIAGFVVGGAGLLGGLLWGWGSMRTASRVVYRVVAAQGANDEQENLERRVRALEARRDSPPDVDEPNTG